MPYFGDGANLTGIAGTTVKHVRQTSNTVRPTGNTSWGVAGSMQVTLTAPSDNCLLFYSYKGKG